MNIYMNNIQYFDVVRNMNMVQLDQLRYSLRWDKLRLYASVVQPPVHPLLQPPVLLCGIAD